jgi:hypothetical protein
VWKHLVPFWSSLERLLWNGLVVCGLTDDHDHGEYEVSTNVVCGNCGEKETACAMCGDPMHICAQSPVVSSGPQIPRGYRQVPGFPEYMVNNQCTVRHIATGKYCMLVRVSKQGGAMVHLRSNGRKYTKAAQELREQAFSGTE